MFFSYVISTSRYKYLGVCFLTMFFFICISMQNIGLENKYNMYSRKPSGIVITKAFHVDSGINNDERAQIKNTSSPLYYVDNSQCKIPYIDPFAEEVMRIYKFKVFETCTNESDLVRPIFDRNTRRYVLHINSSVISQILNSSEIKYTCYYQEITRNDKRGMNLM